MSRVRIYLTENEAEALKKYLTTDYCGDGISLTGDLTFSRGAGTKIVVQCRGCSNEKDITEKICQ